MIGWFICCFLLFKEKYLKKNTIKYENIIDIVFCIFKRKVISGIELDELLIRSKLRHQFLLFIYYNILRMKYFLA